MSEPESPQGERGATRAGGPELARVDLSEERALSAAPDVPPSLAERIAAALRDVPDFPKPGILFKDITPLLADGPLFAEVAAAIAEQHRDRGFDVVAGVEARGFVVAAAVAISAGTGLVPVRKAGKLPAATVTRSYELEYGEATIEVHADAFARHRRVLLVDDVLATGGTLAAAADLVAAAGGELAGTSVILELAALCGRDRLGVPDLRSLLTV